MRIKKENQLGLLFRFIPSMKEGIVNKHMDKNYYNFANPTAEFMSERLSTLNNILNDKNFKDYLITDTVKEIADKIKVGLDFNYKLLNTIKNQASTYLLGKDKFVRFEVKNENIYVLYVDYDYKTTWLNYEMFRIQTVEGKLYGASPKSQHVAELLTKYLIFVNLSDVEIMFLPPNKKVGTKKLGNIKNDSEYNVTVVDSSWNKFVVRTEAFSVSGHLRLQPYGKNLSLRKLVWIEPYEKKGYFKSAKIVND
jgi:hypothetical protein